MSFVFPILTILTLWDDNTLYFPAVVNDNNMSVQSNTTYMQDSAEIFLDGNNDKTQKCGFDDIHFREIIRIQNQ